MYVKEVLRTVHVKSMKQFNREYYLRDLGQVFHYCSADPPNVMWKICKAENFEHITSFRLWQLRQRI